MCYTCCLVIPSIICRKVVPQRKYVMIMPLKSVCMHMFHIQWLGIWSTLAIISLQKKLLWGLFMNRDSNAQHTKVVPMVNQPSSWLTDIMIGSHHHNSTNSVIPGTVEIKTGASWIDWLIYRVCWSNEYIWHRCDDPYLDSGLLELRSKIQDWCVQSVWTKLSNTQKIWL